MSVPILTTKLYAPPIRPELVPRPRLLEQLNAGMYRKLTLVAAPAGFGKTTLVSDWLHHTKAAVAWLSLDEADNDPRHFLTYFIAALQTVQSKIGATIHTFLQPTQNPAFPQLMTSLINDITALQKPLNLVLDDYHVISTPLIHEQLTFLLDHMPPNLHLLLTSRADPPLPLSRLRARGAMTEIRADDLRFTVDEATVFLNNVTNLNLDSEVVAHLERRTEGWIAGLQMAGLSMKAGSDNVDGFISAFTGTHRYIVDYLLDEVLDRQPQPLQQFLLQTSILERMNGPLCEAITKNPSAQTLLEQLEQNNLFIIPLDNQRQWYRYHHLFAELLRHRLQQTQPEIVKQLHHQASRWYAEHGYTTEAIHHALLIHEFAWATELIEQTIASALTHGEVVTVTRWLDALPQETIIERPRLALARAWVLVILDQRDAIDEYLHWAESQLLTLPSDDRRNQGLWGELLTIRAMLAISQGDTEEGQQFLEAALNRLPTENRLIRSVAVTMLGVTYEKMGYLDKASQSLQEAIVLAEQSDNTIMLMTGYTNMARLKEEQAQLAEALQIHQLAIEKLKQFTYLDRQAIVHLPVMGWSFIGVAEIQREQNNFVEAKANLKRVSELMDAEQLDAPRAIYNLIMARILQAEGDIDKASALIAKAVNILQDDAHIYPWVKAVQARLWLQQGDFRSLEQWEQTFPLPIENPKFTEFPGEYTTLARVWMATERFAETWLLLDKLETLAHRCQRTARLLEILMLKALTLQAQGEPHQSIPLLIEALTLGEKGGYIRTFVDEGQPLRTLLLLAQPHLDDRLAKYVQQLLAVFHPNPASQSSKSQLRPQPLIEPLSQRELQALQLLSQGLSNQEIAKHLIIAEGTVKKHLHNIFGKLQVNSRTQAVLQAKALGLLEK